MPEPRRLPVPIPTAARRTSMPVPWWWARPGLETRRRPPSLPAQPCSCPPASGSTLIINGSEVGAVTNAGAASGTGTVTGAFTNSGSLSPGNGGTGIFRVVNGPFTQTASGTLNINLTPSGVAGTGYDQVLIT